MQARSCDTRVYGCYLKRMALYAGAGLSAADRLLMSIRAYNERSHIPYPVKITTSEYSAVMEANLQIRNMAAHAGTAIVKALLDHAIQFSDQPDETVSVTVRRMTELAKNVIKSLLIYGFVVLRKRRPPVSNGGRQVDDDDGNTVYKRQQRKFEREQVGRKIKLDREAYNDIYDPDVPEEEDSRSVDDDDSNSSSDEDRNSNQRELPHFIEATADLMGVVVPSWDMSEWRQRASLATNYGFPDDKVDNDRDAIRFFAYDSGRAPLVAYYHVAAVIIQAMTSAHLISVHSVFPIVATTEKTTIDKAANLGGPDDSVVDVAEGEQLLQEIGEKLSDMERVALHRQIAQLKAEGIYRVPHAEIPFARNANNTVIANAQLQQMSVQTIEKAERMMDDALRFYTHGGNSRYRNPPDVAKDSVNPKNAFRTDVVGRGLEIICDLFDIALDPKMLLTAYDAISVQRNVSAEEIASAIEAHTAERLYLEAANSDLPMEDKISLIEAMVKLPVDSSLDSIAGHLRKHVNAQKDLEKKEKERQIGEKRKRT